jgi:predicted RNA-binding protein with PUA-like domain
VAYWLLKTEPDRYSYQDLVREGRTIWDGVKNNLALKHMRSMTVGDLALIYHTGRERRVVGIAEVVSLPYPDPGLNEPKWVVVDVRSRFLLPQPITLAQIKQQEDLANCQLVRIPRLSVVPLSQEDWQVILTLGDVPMAQI